jgi:hypothetical protein
VSAYCKKNALYYDPFAELVPFFEADPYVFFASGPQELRRLASNCAVNTK